ncbi:YcaO-like family protein [Roseibium sp.]|uniref:YcaO-like family protein n=1 Tax=Roseibium sp. TaxID=1936156 RepID=UPI003A980018
MNGFKDIFLKCADILGGEAGLQRGGAFSEAMNLLEALGGQPDDVGEAVDPAQHENLRSLLALAARCDDLFSLDMPHAPGASFVGAKFCAQSFGINGHGSQVVGAAGRGLTFKQAFESCLGETAEYLSFIERDNDPIGEASRVADNYTPSVANWVAAGLGLQSVEELANLEHVEARSLGSETTKTFPVELVLRRPEHKRLSPRAAHSNGVAAGKTIADAVRSGILELIERDAMMLWWYGGNPANTISNGAAWGKEFLSFIAGCREGSGRVCWFLDISSDVPVPVIAAFSSHVDGSSVVGGFAANPDPRIAATRAFLEMCQMELAQQISCDKQSYLDDDQLSAQDRIWIERDRQLSIDNFPRLKRASTLESLSAHAPNGAERELAKVLDVAGFEAFVVDLTRPDIGIPTARIIIPALQGTDLTWKSERLLAAARKNDFELPIRPETVSPF